MKRTPKLLATTIFYLFLSSSALCQLEIALEPYILEASPEIDKEIIDYDLIRLDHQKAVEDFKRVRHDLNLNLSISNEVMLNLELEEHDIVAPGAILRVNSETGPVTMPLIGPQTYRGGVVGDSDSDVRLMISERMLKLSIQTRDELWYMEPAWKMDSSLPADAYILYKAKDVKSEERTCGINDHNMDFYMVHNESSRPEHRINGDCYTAEIAILADYDYYVDEGGSIATVTDHIVSLLNDVQQEYSYQSSGENFDDGVEFQITEIFLSTCETCDVLSSSLDIGAVLGEFRTWAITGFKSTHDIGLMWSGRDFSGGTIGLAYLDAVCSNFRYNVCENFSDVSVLLRTLLAHELGHNFGAIHDANGAPYIMAPFIQNTSDWSSLSQNDISGNIPQYQCLDICGDSPCEMVTGINISNINDQGFDISYDVSNAGAYRITVEDVSSGMTIYTQSTSSTSLTIQPSEWQDCHHYDVFVENDCGSSLSAPVRSRIFSNVNGCPIIKSSESYRHISSPTFLFQGDSSIDANTYLWDFGDGNISTQVNPSHTYMHEGFYMVTLEVNSNGLYDSVLVQVLPQITPPYTLSDGGNFEVNAWHFASASNSSISLWERGAAGNELTAVDTVWKTLLNDNIPDALNNSVLVTPEFDLSASGDYVLSFDMAMESSFCNGPAGLKVEYSTDNGVSWNTLGSCSDNDLPSISNWYNKGNESSASCSTCDLDSNVFQDQAGWLLTQLSPQRVEYSLTDLLAGQSSVIFRLRFAVTDVFFSGYDIDGVLIDNFQISYTADVPPCTAQSLNLDTSDYPGTFRASTRITATGLHGSGELQLYAQGEIELLPDFEVQLGALLEASIAPCRQ